MKTEEYIQEMLEKYQNEYKYMKCTLNVIKKDYPKEIKMIKDINTIINIIEDNITCIKLELIK